ncbi:MAG: helix-turn-helix domain-containing protein [Syntrophaceae bacterium]|nr:helix-turn-helix domain-containing protein [Syntrophaceae bacterium]
MKRHELGIRLKLLRKNRTQKEFASKYGIPQGTLSKYERGKLEPSVDFLAEVSRREGVSINWILTGEMDEKARKWMLREPAAEYQASPISTRKILSNVVEILESGNEVIIEALKANIRVYLEALRASKDDKNKGRTSKQP